MNAYATHRTALLTAFVACLLVLPAFAFVPPPPRLNVASYILYEANSDTVLAEFEADRRLPVASIVKIMTSYIVVDQAAQDELDITAEIPVSRKAADAIGSQMFLRARSRVAIPDLLKGVVIQSGNDAAIVLAEHVGGSENGFVDIMNSYANHLGMANTLYANSTGLPVDREQYSTARDQSMLTRNLIRFYPEHYGLYKQKEYIYNDIKQRNRNGLLWLDPTVDGVKTGHTNEAGYCLVSSAARGDMRLIAVVMGAATESERNTYSRRLLEYGFRHYATRRVVEQNAMLLNADLYGGITDKIRLGIDADLRVTLPRSEFEEVEILTELDQQLLAPIEAGTAVGTVRVMVNGEAIAEHPLITLQRARALGFLGRIWARLQLFFGRLFG